MKKLLMVSYPFPPNVSAGAVRSERFARYLAEFGWEVDVVTITLRRDSFADAERLNQLSGKIDVHHTRTWDPWLWLRDKRPAFLPARALRSVLMRIFSFPDHMLLWVPFAVKRGLSLCRKNAVHAIYTTSPPHSTHLAGLLLARLKGIPWVADFRDPWTLNAYRDKGIASRIEEMLEKAVLRHATLILANTGANRRNLLQAFPWLNEDKVVLLPNGWEDFPASDKKPAGKDRFTIVHAGTFYPRFKPYAFLHALADWRKGNHPADVPDFPKNMIKVILLGSRDAETAALVEKLELQEVVEIRPWVALDDARAIIQHADVLWASLGTGKESATYIPSKLFEYIAAQKLIFGFFPDGEAAELIRSTNTGVVFTSDEPLPVIRAMVKAMDGGMRYEPCQEAVDRYRVKNLVAELNDILIMMASSG